MPDPWKPPDYALPTKQSDWQPPDYASVVPADTPQAHPYLDKALQIIAGNPFESKEHPIQGPGFMEIPGVSNITNKIQHAIDPTESPFYTGARPFAAGLIKLIGGTLGAGFDPRTAGIAHTPEIKPQMEVPAPIKAPIEAVPEAPIKRPLELPSSSSIKLPATTDNELGMKTTGYTMPGKPTELLKPNSLEPASEVSPSELHETTKVTNPNGDAPPLEEAYDKMRDPEKLSPPPGNARDLNFLEASGGSMDQVLESHPRTKPIVDLVRDQGWDKYKEAVGTNIRKLDDITEGLNTPQLEAFGRLSEGVGTDADKVLIPNVEDRLRDYRAFMDERFKEAKVARKGDLGYIEDYVTHIEKVPEDFKSGLQDIFNYRQGKEAFKALFERPELAKKGTGEASGIYGQGMGSISESPFTKTRTGEGFNLDYNVNKLGRTYLDSMARETYLRPAIEQAEPLIKDLPDSKLKEAAEWYVKNVTKFTASPNMEQAAKKLVRFAIDTTSRSMLGFNPHLQELHLMRLGPVYSELGTKYSAMGLGNLLKNPAAAYREVAEKGMLPTELYPWRFQTKGEKLDSILNFKSMVDFIDRSIAYNGFKAKYLDSGMEPIAAARQATVDAKRTTFMTDPSRAARILNPEYNNVVGRLAAQYKQVPAKIVEWMVRTASDYKQNPAAAARMAALLGVNTASYLAGGPSIFHMPLSLADWSAASMNEMKKIMGYLGKGEIDKAVAEGALWMTPAGLSMKRNLQ